MHESHIACAGCGRTFPLGRMIFRCDKCAGSLEVAFDYNRLKKTLSREKLSKRPFLHSRYLELFPVKKIISLQEGGTPLVMSRNIRKGMHFGLSFKNEALNPTGSFKDRGSSVEIAKALEFHAKNVSCASTGNMGSSLAAYSAIAGLSCYIFTPRDAEIIKLEQIMAYGARVHRVHSDYADTIRLVEEAFREGRTHMLGDYLYRREWTKSIGFELLQQSKPGYIIVPVGNGILISAIWKAIKEFNMLGFSRHKPKLIGVQSDKCSPVVKAFNNKEKITPLRNPRTVASAIECGNPLDGELAVRAIVESKGFAVSVSDREILKARDILARREGLFAEPAGAASLAGLLKARDKIERGSNVVCLVTGHGLKSPVTRVDGKIHDIRYDPSVLGRIFI
ncbi:MAG: threonine synthase [Candidatus Aenigmarchaeota archaeon]|nr:threonine synthase [Candidatus Aenigmarchaeota archaeon]